MRSLTIVAVMVAVLVPGAVLAQSVGDQDYNWRIRGGWFEMNDLGDNFGFGADYLFGAGSDRIMLSADWNRVELARQVGSFADKGALDVDQRWNVTVNYYHEQDTATRDWFYGGGAGWSWVTDGVSDDSPIGHIFGGLNLGERQSYFLQFGFYLGTDYFDTINTNGPYFQLGAQF